MLSDSEVSRAAFSRAAAPKSNLEQLAREQELCSALLWRFAVLSSLSPDLLAPKETALLKPLKLLLRPRQRLCLQTNLGDDHL